MIISMKMKNIIQVNKIIYKLKTRLFILKIRLTPIIKVKSNFNYKVIKIKLKIHCKII